MTLNLAIAAKSSRPDDLGSTSWRPVDLGPAYRDERVEPRATVLRREDDVCILPPGINGLFGDSGDGKSWVACLAAAQRLADGAHVIWITYEDPNEIELVQRLRMLGVTELQSKNLDLFIAMEALTTGIDPLVATIRRRRTSLLVIDSLGEALALSGVDEDRDVDFAKWIRETLRALLDAGRTAEDGLCPDDLVILPIDHSTKAKERSLAPSGTKRKRAVVTGVMLRLEVRQPLGRGLLGVLALTVAKDRSGRFHRGQVAAVITIDARAVPYTVTIARGDDERFTRRNAKERILAVLAEALEPLTSHQIYVLINEDDRIRENERELTERTVNNEISRMRNLLVASPDPSNSMKAAAYTRR